MLRHRERLKIFKFELNKKKFKNKVRTWIFKSVAIYCKFFDYKRSRLLRFFEETEKETRNDDEKIPKMTNPAKKL